MRTRTPCSSSPCELTVAKQTTQTTNETTENKQNKRPPSLDQVAPNARRQRANHHPPTAPCRRSTRREPGPNRGTGPGGPSLLFRAGCFRGHGRCHGSPLRGCPRILGRSPKGVRGELTSPNPRPSPAPRPPLPIHSQSHPCGWRENVWRARTERKCTPDVFPRASPSTHRRC